MFVICENIIYMYMYMYIFLTIHVTRLAAESGLLCQNIEPKYSLQAIIRTKKRPSGFRVHVLARKLCQLSPTFHVMYVVYPFTSHNKCSIKLLHEGIMRDA